MREGRKRKIMNKEHSRWTSESAGSIVESGDKVMRTRPRKEGIDRKR